MGHQLDSYFLCDDSVLTQAFIYEIGSPTTDNSDSMRVVCRYTNATDPGVGTLCSGVGSALPNDGRLSIETDADVNAWNGCPAPAGVVPKRIAAVVVDGQGHGLILSVSGHDPNVAYQFEAAQPFDPATGAVSPVACGTTSGRPRIISESLSGSTATFSLHQDKPPVYTDCDAGTLGQYLQTTSGGLSCDDNFNPAITLGHLYTKTDTCPSLTSGPTSTSPAAPWTAATITPDAAGNATLVATLPAAGSNMCLFIGGSSSFSGSPEALTGYVAVPPAGAASPKAENVAASRANGKIRVTWSTSSEINLAAFKLLTHKKSGLAELISVAPTGAGGASRYSVDVAMSAFQGGKDVVVRALLNDGTFVDAAPVNF